MGMKALNRGFTLVEMMIIIAILGLLSSMVIISIMPAFASASQRAMARNIAEVEKAKAQLTLPEGAVDGAMGATRDTPLTQESEGYTNLLRVLNIASLEKLSIKGRAIEIGTMTDPAYYP